MFDQEILRTLCNNYEKTKKFGSKRTIQENIFPIKV